MMDKEVLEMVNKEAFLYVYNFLSKHNLLMGKFDSRNGSIEYMYGISTVMEEIAYFAGMSEDYDEKFMKNFEESLKK